MNGVNLCPPPTLHSWRGKLYPFAISSVSVESLTHHGQIVFWAELLRLGVNEPGQWHTSSWYLTVTGDTRHAYTHDLDLCPGRNLQALSVRLTNARAVGTCNIQSHYRCAAVLQCTVPFSRSGYCVYHLMYN